MLRRVAVLEVVDLVMRRDVARALDEFIGHAAQALHFVRCEYVANNDSAGFEVFLDLGPAQHGVLLLSTSLTRISHTTQSSGLLCNSMSLIRYLGRTHGNESEGRKTDCFLPDMNRILVAL